MTGNRSKYYRYGIELANAFGIYGFFPATRILLIITAIAAIPLFLIDAIVTRNAPRMILYGLLLAGILYCTFVLVRVVVFLRTSH